MILLNASNKKSLNTANDPHSEMASLEKQIVKESHLAEPETFQLPYLSPIHDIHNPDVHDFISSIGHQLFLGIMKSLLLDMIDVVTILSKTKKYFLTELQRKLKLVKGLNLDIFEVSPACTAKATPGKLSLTGWLCRHLVTFVRISRWLLSHTPSLAQTDEDKELLQKPCPNHKFYWLFQHKQIWRLSKRRRVDISSMPNNKYLRKQ